MTDTFSKTSPTMAKCSHELNKKRFSNFKPLVNH